MYNVSADYLAALGQPIQKYKLKLNIDGTEITDEDIVAGSLSITNQCSDTDIVQIGSVYCAELKFTIAPDIIERNTWQGARVSVSEGMMIEEDPEATPPEVFEYVPLGVFTVAEADHTAQGVNITAYDDMLKFDKSFNLSSTIGSPWEVLSLLCADCGVETVMTRASVEALTNGQEAIALASENDCQTYRDVLFWLAQFLACYATIDRAGKLVLRQYTDQTTQEVQAAFRYEGATFSDFITQYSGVGFTDQDSQEYIYVTDGQDDKLTYNLGVNPFLQYGSMSTRKQQALNILHALKKIAYTPFRARYLNTPAFDLGDVIKNSGGLGAGTFGCIMCYDYNFTQRYTAEGFGKNPALATAANKVDKDIAGLLSRTDKNSIYFYTFKNAGEIEIGDGETQKIIYLRFTTTEAKQVVFQAEILADAEATLDEVVATVSYFLDGAEITDYKPVETWDEDGRHIISLYYMIDVEPQTLYRWEVFLNSSGGEITIPIEGARGTIWGQGLVASDKWDGYIDAEDTIDLIDITRRISLATIADSLEAETIEPHEAEPEDTIGLIDITRRISLASFDAVILIDKPSLYFEGKTWGQVKEETWGAIKNGHTW